MRERKSGILYKKSIRKRKKKMAELERLCRINYEIENGILIVRVREKRYYNDNSTLNFDDVLERMKDCAWDEAGEIAEGYLECSKEDLEWAQEKFLNLWKQFKKRTKNERVYRRI